MQARIRKCPFVPLRSAKHTVTDPSDAVVRRVRHENGLRVEAWKLCLSHALPNPTNTAPVESGSAGTSSLAKRTALLVLFAFSFRRTGPCRVIVQGKRQK